jgi:hypothetical protein
MGNASPSSPTIPATWRMDTFERLPEGNSIRALPRAPGIRQQTNRQVVPVPARTTTTRFLAMRIIV